MQKFILEKGYSYKLFMFIAFLMLALVLYQGYIKNGGIYTFLFFGAAGLCAFQVASFLYVTFVKRTVEVSIDKEKVSWKIFDNKKLIKEDFVFIDKIKDLKTEINYLTGNIYSNFQVTFILDDNSEKVLSDGLIYDFGLKKAEELCRFLLDHELGDVQDIKFAKLIKELDIDLSKEQSFTKKDGKSYYYGFISKNKKEFLGLRLQIDSLYPNYKIIEKNINNEYLVKSAEVKDSFIHIKSNAIGYFVEFYNVTKKEELKSLKQMGKRNKIGF